MDTLSSRIGEATSLDAEFYSRVAGDDSATGQAIAVVVLSCAASHVKALLSAGVMSLILGTIVSLVGWALWVGVTYLLASMMGGTRRADVPSFLRAAGFAAAPGLLGVLFVIPLAGFLLWIASLFWTLATTVIATRETFGLNTLLAIVACVVGFCVCVGFVMGVTGILFTAAHLR